MEAVTFEVFHDVCPGNYADLLSSFSPHVFEYLTRVQPCAI